MNISEISGTMVSDPSTATNQIIVDTGDGLQRAIATSAVSGTIVSDESIETTDCIVDTGSGLQKAVKVAGSGGGGGSSTKYGASIDNFLGDVDANGVLQAPSGEATNLVFTGVKGIGSGLLNEKFYRVMNIASVSFPDLESVTESNALTKCFCPTENVNLTADSLLTSISFPKLASVTGGQAFSYCFARNKNLKSVTFPALTTINGNRTFEYIFSRSGIENVSFPELTTVGSYQAMSFAFHMCKSISTITFPKLNSLTDMCFQSCFQWSTVSSVSFPALTSTSFGGGIQTYFNGMLQGVTGCTVHFPSNLQSVIGSWSDVTAGFGGTNTTVLFDLTATE